MWSIRGPGEMEPGEAMNENSLVDWSIARETVQGDEELLRELVSTFLDELPRLMQSMRAALEAHDAKSLQRHAHTLKGALGHFGAADSYETALRVEVCGRDGDMQNAADALPALEQAMAELTPVLLNYVGGTGPG